MAGDCPAYLLGFLAELKLPDVNHTFPLELLVTPEKAMKMELEALSTALKYIKY